MDHLCNLISCYFLVFACIFFTLIARGLFNFFYRVLFQSFSRGFPNTPIYLIFFVIIRLAIFLTSILFLLCNYTDTIDSNICNVFNMCSYLFQIRCTSLGFLMTTINIHSHVLVYGTYYFISSLYISAISFILLIVVSCDARVHSYAEFDK